MEHSFIGLTFSAFKLGKLQMEANVTFIK